MMLARLTAQGTAVGETALCDRCLTTADLTYFDADDTVTGHVDCSGNDALSCGRCGVAA